AAICPTNALLGAIDLLKSCLGSQIALIEEIDMRQGCLVEMPASELIQLVLNLVLNAKDAMEGSGRIILKAGYHPAKAPSHFFLSVQDFGKGIEENAPLFAPFYTTKEEKNSIGFGLFIIKSIIEKRNGSISIQSKEGSTFHLTFPLKLNMALHHA
ncbi:MAG: sensor hybrid histidine kinase, partial [Chlamydiales bacterium]|nr:sensor hybrid histidine kinase [Chlamydiales bacterium]